MTKKERMLTVVITAVITFIIASFIAYAIYILSFIIIADLTFPPLVK